MAEALCKAFERDIDLADEYRKVNAQFLVFFHSRAVLFYFTFFYF